MGKEIKISLNKNLPAPSLDEFKKIHGEHFAKIDPAIREKAIADKHKELTAPWEKSKSTSSDSKPSQPSDKKQASSAS